MECQEKQRERVEGALTGDERTWLKRRREKEVVRSGDTRGERKRYWCISVCRYMYTHVCEGDRQGGRRGGREGGGVLWSDRVTEGGRVPAETEREMEWDASQSVIPGVIQGPDAQINAV